jgi:hypothetical protein
LSLRARFGHEAQQLFGRFALVVLRVQLFALLNHDARAIIALPAYSAEALDAVSLIGERLGHHQCDPCSRRAVVVAPHSYHGRRNQNRKHLLFIFQGVQLFQHRAVCVGFYQGIDNVQFIDIRIVAVNQNGASLSLF